MNDQYLIKVGSQIGFYNIAYSKIKILLLKKDNFLLYSYFMVLLFVMLLYIY